ncbi:hypothetical protein PC116_g18650 [Phytophthora cactorum]|nr:hypothetical protein Pcac1_g23713 [Phytophthora cactorum]KAG4233125.1 hypothetical protein PC116_g18650 [Phytophthora cactorum]
MLLQLHPHNLMLLWLHRHNLTSYTEQITLVGVTAQSMLDVLSRKSSLTRGNNLKAGVAPTKRSHLFCVRSNKTAVTGNAIIASRQSKAPPIPEEWGFYAKTFECTHAGKYAPRGEGQRPHQNVRPLGCKAQINLCYPTTRLAIRDDVMTSVDILQRSGVKKKKTILKYIREHSDCKPVIRDVHNLVASLKAREIGTATVAERLHKWMVEQQRILKCSKSS